MTGKNLVAAFIVATVRITAAEQFALYGKEIAGLSERFGGVSVVRGPVVEVLEGDSPVGERVVVTRFDTAEGARAYIASPEYRAASLHRIGAAAVVMRLLVDPA